MAAEAVKVELNIDQLVAKLQRMQATSQHLPMDVFGALAVGYVEEMFQTQGAAGTDGEWSPLAAETLRRHPRRIGGMILQDTGAMANVQITKIEEQSVEIKSPKNYARWHIQGTRYMEARNFFALNFHALLDEYAELVMQEIQK